MAVDYLVTVPRDTGVAIESFDGDVTVEGVDGETHVKTVSGDGRLASLARLVAVETFSGNLEIADVRSEDVLTAETVSGRIDIEGVRVPRLEVKSFGGAVALQGVESRRVEVETVSGSVTFDGALAADGRYELRSHSGDIFLTVPGGSGFELDAQSFNGDLRSDIPILVGRGDPSRRTPVFEGGRRAIRGIAAAGGARLNCPPSAATWRSAYALQPCCNRLLRDPRDPLTFDRSDGYSCRHPIGMPGDTPMSRTDLMRGTLDLLILRALTTGPDHGLGIARRVEQITQGAFRVNPGSLFPALHRLAQKGWLTAEWGRSETNRKAKFYELTPDGRHQLEAETRNWKRISVAIDLALDTA